MRRAQVPFTREPNWFHHQERDLKPGKKSGRWKGLRDRPDLCSAGAGRDFRREYSQEQPVKAL